MFSQPDDLPGPPSEPMNDPRTRTGTYLKVKGVAAGIANITCGMTVDGVPFATPPS